MRLLILLFALIATTVKAKDILSCEARSAAGVYEKIDYQAYEKIYPTLIFSEGYKSVSYVYSQHDQQWKTVYYTDKQNEDRLIAISKFNATTVSIFHYDKRSKKFNISWSGGEFVDFDNTFTVGRCFD